MLTGVADTETLKYMQEVHPSVDANGINTNTMLIIILLSRSIHSMVKEFIANNDVAMIKRLTSVLTTEFSVSHNPHSRKGGLIGLAATAIALGKVTIIFGN